MTLELEKVFADLGLSQYLDIFVDQGFDAWDTILDIQESDLDALGVKLGHRRKLQRRIANARGVAPSALLSSMKPGLEDSKHDGARRDLTRGDGTPESSGVTKRKYRRHPKPDENAPERPPSAYVLFSNKMREELKSQNLTFTEIAKLVGENWQSLRPAERDVYESQANASKEKYHQQLAEYKKTPEYRKYAQYLHDFKERQARQAKGQDASKRTRVEPPARLRHGSTSSSATPSGTASGSSSERIQGSEPPPTRRQRVNSTASIAGSQHSATAPTPISTHNSYDGGPSPRALQFESGSPIEAHPHHQPRHPSTGQGRARADSMHRSLPSLTDVLDSRPNGVMYPQPANVASFSGQTGANPPLSMIDIPPVQPPARAPLLPHVPSSGSTGASGVSMGPLPRPAGEGSLPIHALLSDRGMSSAGDLDRQPRPILVGSAAADVNHKPRGPLIVNQGPRGYGFQASSSPFQNMKVEQSSEGDVVMTSDDAVPSPGGLTTKGHLDGVSALLRAGEIVGQPSPR